MPKHLLAVFLIAVSATFCSAQENWKIHQPKLTPQQSGTTQLLISVSPVDSRVVWAAGTGGTYVLTTDGGEHWKAAVVPGAESDQFRDVYGVNDEKVAYLMSIGDNTTDFKVYKTTDGGAHWTIQFTNEDPLGFYDCFAFWTPDHGITHSDSGNGVFPDIRTTNGKTWESIAGNMPPALPGEASFAASWNLDRRRREKQMRGLRPGAQRLRGSWPPKTEAIHGTRMILRCSARQAREEFPWPFATRVTESSAAAT